MFQGLTEGSQEVRQGLLPPRMGLGVQRQADTGERPETKKENETGKTVEEVNSRESKRLNRRQRGRETEVESDTVKLRETGAVSGTE